MKHVSLFVAGLMGLWCVVLWQSAVASIVPDTLRYQGHISDTQGQPVNGRHHLIFTLYDAPEGGSGVWSEAMETELNEGVFSVTLGLIQPFAPGMFDQPLWLGVSLDFGTEQGQRRPLTSTAFVLDQSRADMATTGLPQERVVDAIDRPAKEDIGGDIDVPSVSDVLARISPAVNPAARPSDPPNDPHPPAACPLGCATLFDAHANDPSAHHQNYWTAMGMETIFTPRDFVGINTDGGTVEGTLHVRDSGTTGPALFIEGGNNDEGDITWPDDEHLQLGTWNAAADAFELKVRLNTDGRLELFDNLNLNFSSDLGDRLSLFGNRFNQANMYGFGIAPDTLYYKANGRHAWHVGENADNTPVMALTGTGLGIGTNSPNHELIVQGNDPAMQIRDDSNNNSANAARLELLERAGGTFNGGAFLHWNGETNRLLIGTKLDGVNTNVLVVNRSGNNVGIGTQNPGNHRLAVNGSIRAKEIVVETGWSDFVFDADYALPSLAEVEAHIALKGHLPDIPSAADVAEHGVKLGEMESRLLQKVEELTLYLIDMNRRLQQLETENTRLRQAQAGS